MCTAISYTDERHFLGRTLDYECSFGEEVVLAPRQMPLQFRKLPALHCHYALLGMATVRQGVPLFYDAMNEKGLAMAGLLFAGNADYSQEGSLAPYELIPWILGQCADLQQARQRLEGVALCDLPFEPSLPNSPLHWLLADGSGALVLEPMAEGLKCYEAPLGVLANSPPYPHQLLRLAEYRHLSAEALPPQFAAQLPTHSRGLSAFGLPGDYSSGSRFVRAAFIRAHLRPAVEGQKVEQFFQMMDGVAVPKGCLRLPQGDAYTRYTCCCDTVQGIYYYTTHTNRAISAISFAGANLDWDQPIRYPLQTAPQIAYCNLQEDMI